MRPSASPRPLAAPGLVEAIRATVAPRLAKRLEAGNPAEGWTWSGTTVVTDGNETVTLTGDPVDAIRCTCLLSPKCLHVLAVAAALPSPGGPAPEVVATAPVEPPPPPPEPVVALDGGQRAVVAATRRIATAVLLAGATGVGATARDDLQRAVHGCKAVGLHRLARAGLRVQQHVRDLQRARAEFALEDLVEDLAELLLVAHVLSAGSAPQRWVGTGRRTSEPVGTLRLYGLCTEPIVAATGHAGVATLLCDAESRLWTVSDVRPGGPARARATYEAAIAIGGATLSHGELGRAGLFAQDATASDDGRLGTGEGVRAVRAGPSAWSDPGPRALFDRPIAGQLDGDASWLFVRGHVLGIERDAVLLKTELEAPVRLVPPSDHAELSFRDNLRLLGRAPGLPLQAIGRVQPGARAVGAVAVGPWDAPPEADAVPVPRLVLPAEWSGRCNLAFDRMVSAHVERIGREAFELELPEEERRHALDPFRRRVARLALGGRGTLPGDARGAVEREMAGLRAALMPEAACALGRLAEASAAARTAGGDALATAWLAAAVYARAATRSIHRSAWR